MRPSCLWRRRRTKSDHEGSTRHRQAKRRGPKFAQSREITHGGERLAVRVLGPSAHRSRDARGHALLARNQSPSLSGSRTRSFSREGRAGGSRPLQPCGFQGFGDARRTGRRVAWRPTRYGYGGIVGVDEYSPVVFRTPEFRVFRHSCRYAKSARQSAEATCSRSVIRRTPTRRFSRSASSVCTRR